VDGKAGPPLLPALALGTLGSAVGVEFVILAVVVVVPWVVFCIVVEAAKRDMRKRQEQERDRSGARRDTQDPKPRTSGSGGWSR